MALGAVESPNLNIGVLYHAVKLSQSIAFKVFCDICEVLR